jgi:hypothetical protein
MRHFRLRWRALAQALLLSAGTFLISGAALAQVNGFVVVNPIVVCDSNGANCPPFGMLCSTNATTGVYACTQSTSPSTATVNTPIGFVDGDTNTNVTRAILAAEAGVDVAFFQVRQYNSPNTNADPWPNITTIGAPTPYATTNYQHLHLKTVTCKSGTVQASPDLAALTQHQICTEFGGVKLSNNPPAAPSPAPPLGSTLGESNALDVFFVTDFPGNAVFGISWINGDGVSIGGPATFLVTGPRFDNLDHEIGHALALDHSGFGLTTATTNVMTTGSSRVVPTTSGCSNSNPYPFGTLGGFPNPNGGVLWDLGDTNVYPSTIPVILGKTICLSSPANPQVADKLTQPSGSACTTLSTCTDQVSALKLSPFINKTLASAATAGGGLSGVAGAATTSTGSSSGGFPFEIDAGASGNATGESGDSVHSVIIGLPIDSGVTFSGSSPATQTGGSGGVNIVDQVRLNGNTGIGNPNCTPLNKVPSFQCLQIFFSTGGPNGGGNAFVAGDSVKFNLALNKDNGTISGGNLLNGTQFTVITSTLNTPDAYATTTTGSMTGGAFRADSQFPDFGTPSQINPNFVSQAVRDHGPILSKCTPPYVVVGSGAHQQTLCPGGSLPTDPNNIIE